LYPAAPSRSSASPIAFSLCSSSLAQDETAAMISPPGRVQRIPLDLGYRNVTAVDLGRGGGSA
jgi:hypothetical protein